MHLSPGDLLVLYSDGITEALSSTQELFKWEGIYATVRELRDESAAEVLEGDLEPGRRAPGRRGGRRSHAAGIEGALS